MLRGACRPGLARCALRLHQHSQYLRLSCIATRKDRLSCHTVPSQAAPGVCCGRSSYSSENCNNDRYDYHRKSWHSKTLGTLVGALGTVAVLGLGTVLSETKEDCKCDDEGKRRPDAFVKKEKASLGEDIVGTEREHRADEAVIRYTKPCGAFGKKQTENLSSHELRVKKARQILRRHMEEVGAPGIVVGVTVNGKQVWADGLGFADLENGVRCSPNTVMRIASISKPLTMTAVAKLWEEEKLDLDAPIQKYIPKFPVKTYDGKEVTITTRQLISHKSGIRHYKLRDPNEKEKRDKENDASTEDSKVQSQPQAEKESIVLGNETDEEKEKNNILSKSNDDKNKEQKENQNKTERCSCGKHLSKKRKSRKKKKEKEEDEFDLEEYYFTDEFESVAEALEMFQNDDLFFKPGEGFLYTTHGWTVVSAVVEGATKKPFTKVIQHLFYELGLDNTYLDKPAPIIYNRASYYVRDEHGKLKNAPYVDNSYKWAGGGFLSTVGDLCKFGNAMLYASQQEDGGGTPKVPGYLKASTIHQLWTAVEGTQRGWRDRTYGMGWEAVEERNLQNFCRNSRGHAYHTGSAVGASSILLILPQKEARGSPPQGVVVALLTNMISVSLRKVAMEIAELFEESVEDSSHR